MFHDIAKGAVATTRSWVRWTQKAFCLEQGLSLYDARLVAWLGAESPGTVGVFTEARTIGDPKVINEFARHVGDEVRLDYLYVLTLRRRSRTNPQAVELVEGIAVSRNSMSMSGRRCARGLESPIDQDQLVRENQDSPRALLAAQKVDAAGIERAWAALSPAYFPAPLSRGDCVVHGGCIRSVIPVMTSRWWRSNRAASAVPRRC